MKRTLALALVLLMIPVLSLAGDMDVLFIDSVPGGAPITLTRAGVEIWLNNACGSVRVSVTDPNGSLLLDKDWGELSGAVCLAELYLTLPGCYTIQVAGGSSVWTVTVVSPASSPAPTEYNWLDGGL